MGMPGLWELLIILAIVIILFGAKRLPMIGEGIGGMITNFKKAREKNKEDPSKIDENTTVIKEDSTVSKEDTTVSKESNS